MKYRQGPAAGIWESGGDRGLAVDASCADKRRVAGSPRRSRRFHLQRFHGWRWWSTVQRPPRGRLHLAGKDAGTARLQSRPSVRSFDSCRTGLHGRSARAFPTLTLGAFPGGHPRAAHVAVPVQSRPRAGRQRRGRPGCAELSQAAWNRWTTPVTWSTGPRSRSGDCARSAVRRSANRAGTLPGSTPARPGPSRRRAGGGRCRDPSD